MSPTVNIYYTGSNGNARKFAEEMTSSGLVEQIRGEEGNEKYAYFFPAEDPETVLLIDRWRDQAALEEHLGGYGRRLLRLLEDVSQENPHIRLDTAGETPEE